MLIEDILNQAGVEYEPYGADEFVMSCPFCTGQHDTSGQRKVFGVNKDTGYAHCLRCNWGSKSMVYTARELCKVFGINFSWRLRMSASQFEESVQYEKKVAEAVPVGVPDGYERFRFDADDEIEQAALAYLRTRRIGREEIRRYRLGYAAAGKFAWRILFPVIGEDDQVYGCVGRDFSGVNEAKKYLNTSNIKLLWNGQNEGDTVVVAEGVMDAVRIQRVLDAGQERAVAVAALGSVVTAQQLAQLARYRRAVHFPDFDVEGVKGTIKRAEATAAVLETYVVVPDGMTGQDPGSMSQAEIGGCLRSAAKWGSGVKMRLRLRMSR